MHRTPSDFKKRLLIKFKGEDGPEYEVPARFVSRKVFILGDSHLYRILLSALT